MIHFHFRQGGVEKTWKGASKVDLEDRNRVSAPPQVPTQPRKEGGRCYIASIQRLAGGGGAGPGAAQH